MDAGQVKVNVLDGPACVRYAEDVRKMYVAAGWLHEDEEAGYLGEMLSRTFRISCAVDHGTGHLIGMMRAFSDGVSDAYLLDMTVLPEYRGQGIARKILNCLTDDLHERGIDWIVCISVPGVEKLYLQRGTRMAEHTPVRFL